MYTSLHFRIREWKRSRNEERGERNRFFLSPSLVSMRLRSVKEERRGVEGVKRARLREGV